MNDAGGFLLDISDLVYFLFLNVCGKPNFTKNSGYETGFEEIPVLFNKKTFKIRKQKSKVADSKSKMSLFVTKLIISIYWYHFFVVFLTFM